MLGVAVFDLFPEAIELNGGSKGIGLTALVALIGVLGYGILYRLMPLHNHGEHWHATSSDPAMQTEPPARAVAFRNLFGAGGLAVHSLLDGIGIGLAFKVSFSVGLIAGIGVLVHDFSDGINTVGIVLRNRGNDDQANHWLLVDCIAPLAGVLAASFVSAPRHVMGVLLALFSGFFLFIALFDLLPEGFRHNSRPRAIALTLTGAGVLWLAVHLASR